MKEISGDQPLSRKEQLRYGLIFLKRLPGLFVFGKTTPFIPTTISENTASFFRKYIDAFLLETIPTILPLKEIDMFDIGCGSGYIRRILTDLGYKGTYSGLDVVREDRFNDSESLSFVSHFIQSPIETYTPHRSYDFVLSNTSLEHVVEDDVAVAKAHELAGNHGVEIHIMPSWWSFFLYLWHGYRHYTPRSVTKLFKNSPHRIYSLGGLFSFLAQFFVVFIPERYLGMKPRLSSWYSRFAERMIRLDRFVPFFPIGYAVVVTHGRSS